MDALLPQTGDLPLDDYAAIALLLFFGVKTLADANASGDDKGGEEEGEEAEAKKAVNEFQAPGELAAFVLSTFVLVFAAEWGDKSFLATIALSVRVCQTPGASTRRKDGAARRLIRSELCSLRLYFPNTQGRLFPCGRDWGRPRGPRCRHWVRASARRP